MEQGKQDQSKINEHVMEMEKDREELITGMIKQTSEFTQIKKRGEKIKGRKGQILWKGIHKYEFGDIRCKRYLRREDIICGAEEEITH